MIMGLMLLREIWHQHYWTLKHTHIFVTTHYVQSWNGQFRDWIMYSPKTDHWLLLLRCVCCWLSKNIKRFFCCCFFNNRRLLKNNHTCSLSHYTCVFVCVCVCVVYILKLTYQKSQPVSINSAGFVWSPIIHAIRMFLSCECDWLWPWWWFVWVCIRCDSGVQHAGVCLFGTDVCLLV